MKNIHVLPTDKKPIKGDLLLRHLWKGEANECISWWRYNDTTMYGDTLVYTTLNGSFMDVPSSFKVQNIYITSDEEIKEGDWCHYLNRFGGGNIICQAYRYKDDARMLFARSSSNREIGEGITPLKDECKKIILTTDQDLIADGVQSIDDEFLEWMMSS
jgi:hypothetical protein